MKKIGKAVVIVITLLSSAALAEVPLRGFSDIGFKENSSKTSNFYLGCIDLYFADNISNKTSYLAEVLFETSETNESKLDVERLYVQYFLNSWLKISMGRFHTAMGYWNDNFHHGNYLQTTVNRPLLYRFEDESGFLPMHSIGLELRGEGDLGSGAFGYVFNIANGRGPKVETPQSINDADLSRAYNLLLYYTMPQVENLRFGINYYADRLPGCYSNNGGTSCVSETETWSTLSNRGDESIVGAHFFWAPKAFEVIAELSNMNHSYDTKNLGEADVSLLGGYAQASYKWDEQFSPYIRYDHISTKDNIEDKYTKLKGQKNAHIIGLRYDIESNNAIKVEWSSEETKGSNKNSIITSAAVNWSFTW